MSLWVQVAWQAQQDTGLSVSSFTPRNRGVTTLWLGTLGPGS